MQRGCTPHYNSNPKHLFGLASATVPKQTSAFQREDECFFIHIHQTTHITMIVTA